MNDEMCCRFSGRPIVEGDLVLISEASPRIGNAVRDESQSPPDLLSSDDTGPHIFLRLGEPSDRHTLGPAYILLN
jgi:hypothetical protein